VQNVKLGLDMTHPQDKNTAESSWLRYQTLIVALRVSCFCVAEASVLVPSNKLLNTRACFDSESHAHIAAHLDQKDVNWKLLVLSVAWDVEVRHLSSGCDACDRESNFTRRWRFGYTTEVLHRSEIKSETQTKSQVLFLMPCCLI
jgi:hypothetical protein